MGVEHARLVFVIEKLTGVRLEDDKLYLLESRLGELMKARGLVDFNQVASRIEQGDDKEFVRLVVDRITTHETRFFRDESIFDALAMQIIPEWMQRNGLHSGDLLGGMLTMMQSGGMTVIGDGGGSLPGKRLSIWCAACATGQEPYSIAMLLQEKLPLVARLTDIYATDISEPAVEKARDGIYSRFEMGRGLPDHYLNKYFTRVDDNSYQLSPQIRDRVRFGVHNLIRDTFPCQNDIIFCRNVAIYFSEAQKKGLYEKLQGSLRQDGVLILGSAESLSGYLGNFIIREYGLGRYYELNASQVFMF